MQDRTLCARLLGIEDPWRITDVTLRLDEELSVLIIRPHDPITQRGEHNVIDLSNTADATRLIDDEAHPWFATHDEARHHVRPGLAAGAKPPKAANLA